MIMKLSAKTDYSRFPGQEARMKNGLDTIIDGLKRQRIFDFCRFSLYQIGLANFLVLAAIPSFLIFKEEIDA